jgi:hypothetical protein
MPNSFEAVRAEALFVSHLQCSDLQRPDLQGSELQGSEGQGADLQRCDGPAAERVRRAVATTLRQRGIRGCAAQVAGEFGDHPDTAVPRMRWALATVRSAYAARLSGRPLALAG